MAQALSRRLPINKPIHPAHPNAVLLAYMETKDLQYCQYLFITPESDFYSVRVPNKDSKPIYTDLNTKEAKQVYDDMKYRRVAWKW